MKICKMKVKIKIEIIIGEEELVEMEGSITYDTP